MDDREARERMLRKSKGLKVKEEKVVNEVNESVNTDQIFDIGDVIVENEEKVIPLVEDTKKKKPFKRIGDESITSGM